MSHIGFNTTDKKNDIWGHKLTCPDCFTQATEARIYNKYGNSNGSALRDYKRRKNRTAGDRQLA